MIYSQYPQISAANQLPANYSIPHHATCNEPRLSNDDQQLNKVLNLLLPLLVQILSQLKANNDLNTQPPTKPSPSNSLMGKPIVDAQDGGPATIFTEEGVNSYDISESDAKALGVDLVPGYDYYLGDDDLNGIYSAGDVVLAATNNPNGGIRGIGILKTL